MAAAGIIATVIVAPFVLAYLGGWPGHRNFISELGSGLGIAAFGMLGLLLMLPSRLKVLEALGADTAVRLHRRVATGFVAVLAGHIAVAVAADPSRIGLFRFSGQPWRAEAAITSTFAIALLFISSRFRSRIRISYRRWRALHVTLAVAALAFAVLHTVGWARYLSTGAGILGLVGVSGAALLSVGWLRVGRPRRLGETTYVVERVVRERGDSATIELRAEKHAGRRYRPGQFAWIKYADRKLSFDEHPFSYSSSALRPERPSFTIRAYSGFSAVAQRLPRGTRLIVDGPYGSFRPPRRAAGMALIANGIGITPMMSILRTAADTGDRRRYVLIYGSRDAEGITFREELAALERRLALTVVHVLSRPEPWWKGVRGRIDEAVLQWALPADLHGWEFFLCGSRLAVNSSLRALERLRVPPERIHAERFVPV
jgi:predicted ferric reductase